MKMKIVLVVLISTFSLTICLDLERPIVTTSLGLVVGNHKTSFTSKIFSAFLGIPYAKAPIGDLRFKEPQPVEKWNTSLDASVLKSCPQIESFTKKFKPSGDEDCLYLNIYVPREYPKLTDNLDVIVHIHGGGFMFGSGHDYAHPGYLMDRDIILVTFNYRLGIFGFLSTEDEIVPGNNGMKDQVLALKWVKNNIASFGGNPNSVTLTGASAGAASVHLHYFSKLSVGLFHKGLQQSGCALNPWVINHNSKNKAKKLGQALGCLDDNSRDLVACLKEKNYIDILNKTFDFYDYKWYPVVVFGPVVEKNSPSGFLTDDPATLLRKKQGQDLPLVLSFVPQEGGSLFPNFRDSIHELDSIWTKVASILLYYEDKIRNDTWDNPASKIKEFYLGPNGTFANQHGLDKFIEMVTDRMIIEGIEETITLQSKATNSSIYLYELSYTGDHKNSVEHADDNQYFFDNQHPRDATSNELKMKDVMVDMLVSYVKTGHPTIQGVEWPTVSPNNLTFLNISGFATNDIKITNSTCLGNVNFWQSVGL